MVLTEWLSGRRCYNLDSSVPLLLSASSSCSWVSIDSLPHISWCFSSFRDSDLPRIHGMSILDVTMIVLNLILLLSLHSDSSMEPAIAPDVALRCSEMPLHPLLLSSDDIPLLHRNIRRPRTDRLFRQRNSASDLDLTSSTTAARLVRRRRRPIRQRA